LEPCANQGLSLNFRPKHPKYNPDPVRVQHTSPSTTATERIRPSTVSALSLPPTPLAGRAVPAAIG